MKMNLEVTFGRRWSCGTGGAELAEKKKFSPGGAAGGSGEGPPRFAEENFLDGSSTGRGGEEFISGQNSGLPARYFRPG